MAFYQQIQRLLLLGVRLPGGTAVPPAPTPAPLDQIVQAVAPAYAQFNDRALHCGNRYRSAYWSIYLLSALAILCAVIPLALEDAVGARGWHALLEAAGVAEIVVIGIVGLLVWAGNHKDWHAQWMAARTCAEMAWYLPLLAPLVSWGGDGDEPRAASWYARVFGSDGMPMAEDDIGALCQQIDPRATQLLHDLWSDADFGARYARWAISVFDGQRAYHAGVLARQRALIRRTSRINAVLFALTALGALAHLFLHTPLLLLLTIFFPALGASLHGALAQSEAYRLAMTSERLGAELAEITARIARAAEQTPAVGPALCEAVGAGISLVLDEHRDWHMLVRPHHLPLA